MDQQDAQHGDAHEPNADETVQSINDAPASGADVPDDKVDEAAGAAEKAVDEQPLAAQQSDEELGNN